jgi:tetratricopeptide (TPR) repeat protein
VSTLIDTQESRKLIHYLRCAVAFVIEHDLFAPGKSIIANAEGAMRKEILDRDEYLVVLREMTKFLTHFNQVPEATDVFCRAAMHLSQLGSFQSAYRILRDADEMVQESKSKDELPKVLAAHAVVASDEGDYLYAEEHFLKAINLLQDLEQSVPEEYLVNLAAAQMWLNKFVAAAETFEKILSDDSLKSDRRFTAATNLAVCKRNLKQPDTLEAIDRARTFWTNEVTMEASAELELVACKTYLEAKLYEKARSALTAAVELLDQELLQINRLHYRRGFREPYVQRVVSMLCELPEQGRADEILRYLAFVKSSSFSDWMCVLDWYETAMTNSLLEVDKRAQLAADLRRVLELGAPVLYGYREKYEDAFESPPTLKIQRLEAKRSR